MSAVVDSFNELLPGVPWNDTVVNTIKWEVAANAGCIGFPVFVAHGDADVELEMRERTRAATKDGLLDLLLETRRVIKCLQHGPCATCVARDPPQHNMRLTPEGGCVTCVLKTFLQA